MILEAMTALLSLPRVSSQRFNKSRMTVTRNLMPDHAPQQQSTAVRLSWRAGSWMSTTPWPRP